MAPNPQDDTPLPLKSAKLAIAMEKTILPCIYAFLAYQRFTAALKDYHAIKLFPRLPQIPANTRELICASLTKNTLLLIFLSLCGAMLLFSRPPSALPDKRKHLLVPLAMSYYFVLFGMLDFLPLSLRENLLPPAWQFPASMFGVILSLIGYSIAIWAIFYLRRSFSIFVSVREITLKGPYAYVRHPIYLGYLFDLCGITLAGFSIAVLFLGCGFVLLLVARARMEEEKLSEASAYRLYMERTGFLFPRLRTRAPLPAA
jgi:protein-S-isoprenylcysteine O-methyltransferase Ste14